MRRPAKYYKVPVRFPSNIKERIRKKTVPPSVFSKMYRRNDYPQKWYKGRSQGVHRVLWQEKRGAIPKGMVVHHKKGDKWNAEPKISDLELKPSKIHAAEHGGDWAR